MKQILQKCRFLPKISINKNCCYESRQTFFGSNVLMNFEEKPLWLQKFKLKQARMQKHDGVPVYLKAGFRDKLLFNITLALVLIGCAKSWYVLYTMANKK